MSLQMTRSLLFFMAVECSIVYMYHIFFSSIHLLIDTYVASKSCLLCQCCSKHGSANISFIYWYWWGGGSIYPAVELLNHTVALFLAFWETSELFSIEVALIYIPTNSVQRFCFLHILFFLLLLLFFFWDGIHSCCPTWSAMVQSWLTATSTPQVQMILLSQAPE